MSDPHQASGVQILDKTPQFKTLAELDEYIVSVIMRTLFNWFNDESKGGLYQKFKDLNKGWNGH